MNQPDERRQPGCECEVDKVPRVAHDFSDYSEWALHYALSLAQAYHVELHLLHVLSAPVLNQPEIAWMPSSVEGSYHEAARGLQKAVPGEAYLWCKVKTTVRWGKPYSEVLSFAREYDIDLICIGAHGKGFSMQALFGSSVDRVIRRSPCPTLVTRPLRPDNFTSFDVHDQGIGASR